MNTNRKSQFKVSGGAGSEKRLAKNWVPISVNKVVFKWKVMKYNTRYVYIRNIINNFTSLSIFEILPNRASRSFLSSAASSNNPASLNRLQSSTFPASNPATTTSFAAFSFKRPSGGGGGPSANATAFPFPLFLWFPVVPLLGPSLRCPIDNVGIGFFCGVNITKSKIS